MFNKDFYPTPPDVIERMINGNDLHGKVVLEPSAGSGNILDFVSGLGASTIACELDDKLRIITQQKSDRFLVSDFLTVSSEDVSHVNYIYMNPPFSSGDKHILHAWEVAPDGCEIAALCNIETLHNGYNRSRSRLNGIVSNFGYYENLGDCFSDAERKTGVEVALVRLYKPSKEGTFDDYFCLEQDEVEAQENGLMSYNAVRDVVNRYVQACKLYDQVSDNAVLMNSLVGEFIPRDLSFTLKADDKPQSMRAFKTELQKKAWWWVFGKMNMGKFITKNLKEELNKFVEQQSNVPFTMRNIYKMIDMIIQTHGQRMERALIEVFDRLTEHYHDNRYNVEGWKTNSHYLVGKKFIFPWIMSRKDWSNGLEIRYDNRNAQILEDLIKALDYITGKREFDNIKSGCLYVHSLDMEILPNTWYDLGYFEIKGFKKGTMHCKWKSEEEWALFNRAVAESKGWELPEKI